MFRNIILASPMMLDQHMIQFMPSLALSNFANRVYRRLEPLLEEIRKAVRWVSVDGESLDPT
jgi:hypothetical protein